MPSQIHDHLAVQDPVLLRRRVVADFGPAPQQTDAADLSQGAAGLVLELTMNQPVTLTQPTRRKRRAVKTRTNEAQPDAPQTNEIQAHALLIAPSRPGQAIALAHQRQLI